MGLKEWLTKKAISHQAKQITSMTDAIDQVLTEKAKRLRKKNRPVSRKNLLAGSKALAILGISEETIAARIDELGLVDNHDKEQQ